MIIGGANSGPLSGWTVPRPVARRLKVTSTPSVQPVTLDELKAHLRITTTDDDAYLTVLIITATTMAENYLSRAFINRTLRMWMDRLPGMGRIDNEQEWGIPALLLSGASRAIELMRVPVASVAQVVFVSDGVETVVPASAYIADVDDPDMPGRVILKQGAAWPGSSNPAKALFVDYTAGYGTTAGSVPAPLRHGIMLIAAALWSNRGDNSDQHGDVLQLPAIRAVLEPYRVMSVSSL